MTRALTLSACLLFYIFNSFGAASELRPADRRQDLRRTRTPRTGLETARTDAATLTDAGNNGASVSHSVSSGNRRKYRVMQGDQSSGPGRRLLPGRAQAVRGQMQRRNQGAHDMVQDDSTSKQARMPNGAGSPNLLASFAGKSRLLVISAPHESDGYYRLMMSLLKPDVYCELADRHVQQIVMFHQEGELGGKVRRITSEGKILEEPLDTALIPRLMNFLKLEKGKFSMVLLRKTLQVQERYPYPVRLEAMHEVIDQTPMRKFEQASQKGFVKKCRLAGVEGQVVEGGVPGTSDSQVDKPVGKTLVKKGRKPSRRPTIILPAVITTLTTRSTTTTTTTRPTTTTTTTQPTTTTTTTRTTTTTTRPTTTQSTTTTRQTTTSRPTRATTTTLKPFKTQTTSFWVPSTSSTMEYNYPPTKDRRRGKQNPKATPYPSPNIDYDNSVSAGRYRDNQTDNDDRDRTQAAAAPADHKPTKTKSPKKKNGMKVLSNEYDDKFDVARPTAGGTDETVAVPSKKGRGRHDKAERKRKKGEKGERMGKQDKSEKKLKLGRVGKGEHRHRKSGKGTLKSEEKEDFQKPSKKPEPPRGSLSSFLSYFESRRRLVVITTLHEEDKMYIQQRDEYLEHVCEMAVRKVSIITIFGTLTNSTMKIDHYQLESDRPMKGLREEDLVNQDLIIELRKEFGMTFDEFLMVITDFDVRVKQVYEVPIAMKSVFDYIDTFSSRIKEMEQQKKDGVTCKKEDKPRSLENFLSRFRWRRRLFIISAPNDEEWAYQQQLYALNSQACNLGLRHVSVLKLLGVDAVDMGGVLELYPINGSATVEREGLSSSLVRDIRNYFQISPEYFSMLLVGKDGNVKSWYPTPMWSMAIIYDLIDSMQLRRQEMAIQQSLGMRCPEDEYGGYGYHHHGYHEGYQDGYHQGYGY